jgi:hypothetical protein
MRSSTTLALALSLVLGAACVPADEALPLGSAEFMITTRGSPRTLLPDRVADGWTLHVDRFLVSFKTMTIVNLANSDQCAYRGRGASTNLVFEGTEGTAIQAFNGIKPGACPDVGMRLGPPDDRTVVGEGARPEDLVALAKGSPAHALLEVTATPPVWLGSTQKVMHVVLRFETATTSSAFGGCRDAVRGARIRPNARDGIFVEFAAEAFFRDAISRSAQLRFSPFVAADQGGNDDGTVTMDELDALPLSSALSFGGFYELPNGTRTGSFGGYVRAQFELAVNFGDGGVCNGLDPGTAVDL